LFDWRREARRACAEAVEAPAAFVPAVVEAPSSPPEPQPHPVPRRRRSSRRSAAEGIELDTSKNLPNSDFFGYQAIQVIGPGLRAKWVFRDVQLEIGGVVVRIGSAASPKAIAAVMRALKGGS
jgi:hypothetical protein